MNLRGIIGLGIFIITTALAVAQTSPENERPSFDELETWQQRDFSILLRKLYVIGDPEIPTGLFEIQKSIIEDLRLAAAESKDPEKAISQITGLSAYRTRVADRTFEFRRSIAMQTSKIYEAEIAKLPADSRNFDRLMTLKVLEFKQREFALLHPYVASFEVLGGLRGFYVQQYFEALNLNPSLNLLNALKQGLPLTFENFTELLALLGSEITSENLGQHFESYAWYRLIAPLNYSKYSSKEDFVKSFDTRLADLMTQAQERNLPSPKLEADEKFIQFLWLLQNWQNQNSSSISWEWKSDQVEALSGWSFLLSQYEAKWPEFARLPEQATFDEPAKKLIAEEVDEFVVSLFEAENASDFLAAIEEFKAGNWLDLPEQDSSLRHLPEELRRILAARLFPDLSVRSARALLEGTWFESLAEMDRREALSLIYATQIPEEELQKNLALGTASHELIRQYHYDLIKKYLSGAHIQKPPPDFLTMANGEKVPLLEKQRAATRLFFAQNRDKLDYGIAIPALVEELTVLLYPSLDHLSVNEPKRFSNEWARQNVLHEMISAQNNHIKRIKESKTDEEKEREEKAYSETIQTFQERLSHYPIDPDSEATWIAAFLAGARPHSNEIPDILKAVGTGAVFAIAVKIFGIRAVGWFVVLDTGARLVTAGYLKDDLVNLNLESGYSTFVGKMTAQSLQDGLKLWGRLQSANSPEEELEAAYDLGTLGSDFVWFGVGSASVAWSIDLSSYRRARRANNLHREILKMEKSMKESAARSESLRSELSRLQGDFERLQWTGQGSSLHAKEVSLRIDEVRTEIFELESVRSGRRQGPTEFYSRALIGSVVDLVKSIVPTSRPLSQRFSRMTRRWTGRSRLGSEQFAREVSRIESEIFKIEADEWAWQSKPFRSRAASEFKANFRKFKAAQEQMSLHIQEAKIALEASSKISPKKAANLYETAQKSLVKAKEAWAKSRESLQSSQDLASHIGERPQALNDFVKSTYQRVTGRDLAIQNLDRFPKRMRSILDFQRAWIDELISQIPEGP